MLHWGNECPESEQVPGNSGTVVVHTSDKTTSSMILERGRRFLHAHPLFSFGWDTGTGIHLSHICLARIIRFDGHTTRTGHTGPVLLSIVTRKHE